MLSIHDNWMKNETIRSAIISYRNNLRIRLHTRGVERAKSKEALRIIAFAGNSMSCAVAEMKALRRQDA
jgi:hypothetical protein